MSEFFDIPVEYKGETINISARIINAGYVHKIEIELNGNTIVLEPDEERNYRAIIEGRNGDEYQHVDKELLGRIIKVIEASVQ